MNVSEATKFLLENTEYKLTITGFGFDGIFVSKYDEDVLRRVTTCYNSEDNTVEEAFLAFNEQEGTWQLFYRGNAYTITPDRLLLSFENTEVIKALVSEEGTNWFDVLAAAKGHDPKGTATVCYRENVVVRIGGEEGATGLVTENDSICFIKEVFFMGASYVAVTVKNGELENVFKLYF